MCVCEQVRMTAGWWNWTAAFGSYQLPAFVSFSIQTISAKHVTRSENKHSAATMLPCTKLDRYLDVCFHSSCGVCYKEKKMKIIWRPLKNKETWKIRQICHYRQALVNMFIVTLVWPFEHHKITENKYKHYKSQTLQNWQEKKNTTNQMKLTWIEIRTYKCNNEKYKDIIANNA